MARSRHNRTEEPPEDCPVCTGRMTPKVRAGGWSMQECVNCYYSRQKRDFGGGTIEGIGLIVLEYNLHVGSNDEVAAIMNKRDLVLAEAREMVKQPQCQAFLKTLRNADPNIIEVYQQYRDWLEDEGRFPLNLAVASAEIEGYVARRNAGIDEEPEPPGLEESKPQI